MSINRGVSVVIATYNMGHLILETIDSCIQQRGVDLEIIVYDDCSTDGTEKIGLDKHPMIKYIRGEENLGVGSAFNEAVRHATKQYILLMCADDLFTNENVLADMCYAMESHFSIGHVSRWYHQFVGNDPPR